MPVVDSLNKLLSDGIPGIIFMFGEEKFLLDGAYNLILSKLIPDDQAKFDFELIDAASSDYNTIVDSCLSFPFVSERRVVVVKNFEQLLGKATKKDITHTGFDKYLENPQSTTCLILIGDMSTLNGISSELINSKKKTKAEQKIKSLQFPLNKIFTKHSCIEFEKLKESQYPKWIVEKLAQSSKQITGEALEFLIAQTNFNLYEINNEIDKLLLSTSHKKSIDIDDIANSLGTSRIYNVFELQKAVGRKDLSSSITIMQKMLEHEKQEVLIVTVLSRFFVTLWKLEEMIRQNNNQYVIAGTVGINPYFVPEYTDTLKRYSSKQINSAIKTLTNIDEKIKSSSVSAKYLLEKFFIETMGK